MKYIFALLLTLVSAGSAFADSHDTSVSDIPFDFVAGSTNFPAGTYFISRVSEDPSGALLIRSKDGSKSAFVHPLTAEPSNPNGDAKLRFRHEGDQYFLVEFFGGLDTYTINSSRSHHKSASPDDTVTVIP